MTLFNLNYLLKILSPNSHREIKISLYECGGDRVQSVTGSKGFMKGFAWVWREMKSEPEVRPDLQAPGSRENLKKSYTSICFQRVGAS